MPRPTLPRGLRRTGALTMVAFAASVTLAGPAAAHTEVEAEGARALDQNVALTFTAESESGTAGISKLEVILPEGITPQDITYKNGPQGWKLAPTGRGYTVSGPKLRVGEDAEYVVTVRQLPDAETLVFKTLQTYGDGRVDRWIELDEDNGGDDHGHGHGHPAPQLALKPAAPGAKAVSPTPTEKPESATPSTGAPANSPSPSAPSAGASADDAADDDSIPVALPIGIGAAVVVLAAGAWWFRSRRSGSS